MAVSSLSHFFGRDEFEHIIRLLVLDKGDPYPLSIVCCDFATSGGHLDVFKWCATQWRYMAIESAAEHGQLDALKWAFENSHVTKYDHHVYCCAAKSGHIHVLQWAKDVGIIPDDDEYRDDTTWFGAAESGHRETLKWARKNGFIWDYRVCAGAAKGGHLPLLQWLRKEGCPWNYCTTKEAAESGHLDILMWAHANGCDMDSDVCGYATKGGYYATKGGYLEMLKWARANGFSWGMYTMWWAALYDNIEVLKWAHANGCVCSHTRWPSLYGCASKASYEVIEWVRENLQVGS